jgi:vesicle-fusing ATPase
VQSTANAVRSALGERAVNNENPDLFLNSVLQQATINSNKNNPLKDRKNFEDTMKGSSSDLLEPKIPNVGAHVASSRVSELVARAGSAEAFTGEVMGIGGLDDVLAQIKRRVWIPLAAPPQLLEELGIQPVRGLLLYGFPGCGKTLLARQLGKLLSPLRPITIVEGPSIMDKFVGSSEKKLREIFDNPPDIYDTYRLREADNGKSIARAALHVIIMDEFDAIARARGGRGGLGDQGDAGVARDSVVNQLLAKMDGVEPLVVPTLVIGLTNKRSLIEPALLRPGRFEVQIEVPHPKSIEARISILNVHTKNMHRAGRLLVRDAPKGSAAAKVASSNMLSYDQLLLQLAAECDGFSGASIAGFCRAAASHALERAVTDYSDHDGRSMLADCAVKKEDFEAAIQDVLVSTGDTDWAIDEVDASPKASIEEPELDADPESTTL